MTGNGLRGAQTGDYRLLVDLFGSFPEMDVRGLGLSIASGDLTPSLTDQTDFGDVDVDDVVAGAGFTIANLGAGMLNLTGSPRVQISGPAAADFSITLQPSGSVSAGSLSSFFVGFNPSAVGLRTAIVSIANNDPNESPYVFAIQGTGVAAETLPPLLVTGVGAGGEARVRLLDSRGMVEQASFLPFGPDFRGGVRVAMGDVNGDGTPDMIAAAGPGGGPHVRVFDGVSGEQLTGTIGGFFAFGPGFIGGVFVAAGDVNGDGWDDIIAAAGAGGGPHVRVFSGRDGSPLQGFFAYGVGFTGGVTVAAGDVNDDGRADIITGAAPAADRTSASSAARRVSNFPAPLATSSPMARPSPAAYGLPPVT